MKKKTEKKPATVLSTTEAFEAALEKNEQGCRILRLYVSGMTPNSRKAIDNIKKICEEHLNGFYELEIIDIYQQPIFAKEGQIVAAPTLVKELPPPLRKFIGDMSQTDKILLGLDLRSKVANADKKKKNT